jgi:hypothetical protein
LATVYNDLLQKFIARQQELHQKVIQKRQQQQASQPAFQIPKQPSQELYQLPPDNFGYNTGFGDAFSSESTPLSAQCKFLCEFLLKAWIYEFLIYEVNL